MATKPTEDSEAEYNRAHRLALRGGTLTEAQALELERELSAEPGNLDLRTQLLGYFMGRQYPPDADNAARSKHILWLITNRPESLIAGTPYSHLDKNIDAVAYARAKALWLEQVQRNPENLAVLNNAAQFFLHSDAELADDLFGRAQALEPDNALWLFSRGHLAALELLRGSADARVGQALAALAFYRQALALDAEEEFRETLLQHAAALALEAQAFDEAKQYADELLAYGLRRPREQAGDALHHANLVLGRLALISNQRDEAKSYLLKAGDVADSPVLGSFGPNMQLAKALLEADERETVLQYFDLCSRFWKRGKLQEWREVAARGEIPDFGGNLNY